MDSAICLFNVIERASVHSVYMFNVGAYMAEKISVSKCAGINNIENKIIAQRNENNSKITHSWCICIGYRGVLVDRFCMQSMDCFLDAYFFQRMCDIQPEQAFYIFVWLRSLTVYWFVFVSLASCFLTLSPFFSLYWIHCFVRTDVCAKLQFNAFNQRKKRQQSCGQWLW